MPFKFNPITGALDLVNPSVTGSGVFGPPTSTDKAIARWNGTTGNMIQDSPNTLVQDSGAVQAQGFITKRVVTGNVDVPSGYSWIAPSVAIDPGGSIVINSDAELIII